MEEYIEFKDGSKVFITGVDFSNCEHDDNGEPIITFYNSHDIMKQCDYLKLSNIEKEKLNVSGGSCTCSKCGLASWTINNPYYL
jgi:hypothetical protein